MKNYIHKLSATVFYTLGVLFFAAYFCYYNELLSGWPTWFFEVFDLPMALAACLYGGLSLHSSVTNESGKGKVLGVVITIFLLILLGWLIALNYWDLLNLPTTK